jgi:hypothetical protein
VDRRLEHGEPYLDFFGDTPPLRLVENHARGADPDRGRLIRRQQLDERVVVALAGYRDWQ